MITPPYVTVKEANKKTDLSVRQIQNLVQKGRVDGHKLGNSWLVNLEALKIYLEQPKKVGRPKAVKDDSDLKL